MSRQVISALLVASLLALTLPLFYLLFTRVILPTLWQEDGSQSSSPPAIEASPRLEEPTSPSDN